MDIRWVGAFLALFLTAVTPEAARAGEWLDDLPICQDYRNAAPSIEACTRLIESGRADDELLSMVYSLRGQARARSAQYEAALKDFKKSLDLKPTDKTTISISTIDLAAVHLKLQQPEEARAVFWKLARDPGELTGPWAVYALATDPQLQRKESEELVAAGRAMVAKQDNAGSHRALGLALANAGHSDEAVAEISKALEMAKANGKARQNTFDGMQRQIDAISAGKPVTEEAVPY